jgi:hypothetical protein
MSWHFSRALVEEYLGGTCSAGEQYAPWRLTPTQSGFLSPDRMKAFSRLSRFGMTFAPLTDLPGEAMSMWCRGDSRVPTSAPPGMGLVSTANPADFGPRWHESSVRYDRDWSMWKTHRCLFQEDLPESSVILPRWGMLRAGVLWGPRTCPVKRHTQETGYGLLPTPSGTTGAGNHVVGRLDEWGGSSNPFRGTSLASLRLPGLEEWMLGWPESWTELTPLGTDKFHAWLRLHGKS